MCRGIRVSCELVGEDSGVCEEGHIGVWGGTGRRGMGNGVSRGILE